MRSAGARRAGVVGGLAVWWFYLALAGGPMSIVSPLTAVLVAGLPVLIGMLMGERPGPVALAGIVLALVAVVLVSRESPDAVTEEITGGRKLRFDRRIALLTVGSGVAFAAAFVFLHKVPEGTGLWPLIASRVTATAVVWAVAVAGRQFVAATRRTAAPRRLHQRPRRHRQRRDAVRAAGFDAVADQRDRLALSGGDGAAGDGAARRTCGPPAAGRHGRRAGVGRDDRGELTATLPRRARCTPSLRSRCH